MADPAGEPARLAFRVAYLGAGFLGSQLLPGERTVEGEFIAAGERLGLYPDRHAGRVAFAGRTDRGVHARGQVAALTTPHAGRAREALNYHLPPDCWCTGVAHVDPDFHPRYAALSRTYRYYFPGEGFDRGAMEDAASRFCGCHDFSAFARVREGKDPVRKVLFARIGDEHGLTFLEVTGESFLWHMVRCMASGVFAAGRKEVSPSWVSARLGGESGRPIPPAPPEGLILWDVDCGLSFTPLAIDDRSLRFLMREQDFHRTMGAVTLDLGGCS